MGEAEWSIELVVAAGTGIDSSSWEVEVGFPEEVSEAAPIPAATHLVYQKQCREAEIPDADREGEGAGLMGLLVGAVAAEAAANA